MQSSGSASGALSLLSPIGFQSGDCGYCKKEESSASYYARSRSLSPDHYQELMDRGWRRSGTLLYLPDVSRSCCPHYTIRLPASHFKASRDQRQALHRWNRHVLGEKYAKEAAIKYPIAKEDKKRLHSSFDLVGTVHEPEKSRVKQDIETDHNFEVSLESDDFTEEKFALFGNYQRHVHHEADGEISRAGFKRFLCSSPIHISREPDGKLLGSYHQCYRLDGRLIAMGVLDLLPHSVSGVYFLYHSDYEKWSFGKLSALRELSLALEEGYEYYYMGYYIHQCKKMRYKGDYKPQYVLDYDSLEWDIVDDEMRSLMDRPKYMSMSKHRAQLASRAGAPNTRTDPRYSAPMSIDDDEDDKTLHSNPVNAFNSNLSLLELGMPGVMTLSQMRREINLDEMEVMLRRGSVHEMRDIMSWLDGSDTDSASLKGIIAEFAAAVGPNIAREITVDLSQA